jgi:HD-like signal output (HDOD) protein
MSHFPAGDPRVRANADEAGFGFARELAEALAAGPVELPGFPEVALRVQEVLADDSVSTELVVRVVGAEPMLAARVVTIANSVAMNPGGSPVTELRTAVARMGFDLLRAAAVSFAVAQLRRREEYLGIVQPLNHLWLESISLSATCSVVARHCGRVSPDKALFAGLVAGVGRIYLLARASRHPGLLADTATYQAIQEHWHASVARSLLHSWHVAEETIDAVMNHGRPELEPPLATALSDVLASAAFLNRHSESPEAMTGQLPQARALARLGLKLGDCILLMQRGGDELTQLRTAIGR